MVRSALHTVWAVTGMGWILCCATSSVQGTDVATSGPVLAGSERVSAPVSPRDPVDAQILEAKDTVGKLRVALYDMVKCRKQAEQERDSARTHVRRLEAQLGPLKVAADNTAASLREEMALREEMEARVMQQADEILRLRETAAKLQDDIARLEQVSTEPVITPAEVIAAADIDDLRDPMPSGRAAAPEVEVVHEGNGTPAVDELMMEANRLLRLGDADRAAELFTRVLQSRPNDPGAGLGLAASRYAAGQTAEALERVNTLLKEDRNNAQALGVKALIVWRQGDLRQADRLLAKAIRMDPDDVRLRNYRGIVGYERKKYDDALKDLEWAVDLDPADPESRFNLAVLLAGKPDPDLEMARAHYQAALKYGGIRDEELERALSR